MSEKFEKIVTMRGAFDKRDPNPGKNYGIHGMEIRFVLKGEKGATQFLVYTNMHLPHVSKELFEKQRGNPGEKYNRFDPMGADIGYHAIEPQYEGQESRECDLLPNGRCYCNGSSLQADEFMPTFLAGGSDAVWEMLEQRYNEWLEPKQED